MAGTFFDYTPGYLDVRFEHGDSFDYIDMHIRMLGATVITTDCVDEFNKEAPVHHVDPAAEFTVCMSSVFCPFKDSIMIILLIYLGLTTLLALWFGWKMYQGLDKYDWAYYRSEIWLDFWMRLITWPLAIIFKPGIFLRPSFKQKSFGGDQADCHRQKVRFMESPPLCGVMVSYRPDSKANEKESTEFNFRAADVEEFARKIIDESPRVEGIRSAARWTSCRDESILSPTLVPEILPNFSMIAEDLIVAGLGQVRCPECDKTYTASEISCESSGIYFVRSGWVYNFLICPFRHKLLGWEVMHLLLRRQEE